jgi:hypothetical protein
MESAIPYSGRFRLSEDYIRASRRDEDEWAELAAGIVLFAFKDYVEALYKLIILADSANRTPHETMKNEIEVFFRSPWYRMLTSINPEWVIREAREQAMAKAMKHMERQVIREMKRETRGKDEEAMI